MGVHLVGDTIAKLSTLRGMLEKRYTLKTELLSHADLLGQDIEAVVIAADLRDVENITALKEISPKLARIPKRIFLIDRKSRLSTVQAYALGATSVLSNTVNRTQLLAKLADPHAPTLEPFAAHMKAPISTACWSPASPSISDSASASPRSISSGSIWPRCSTTSA